MPSDVAMERPNTRVVRIDLYDNIRWFSVAGCCWQQLDITSLRVLAVGDSTVERSGSLSQNVPNIVSKCHI